ncbi:MAG: S8 family serine peptidase [Leptospirales bacterium]
MFLTLCLVLSCTLVSFCRPPVNLDEAQNSKTKTSVDPLFQYQWYLNNKEHPKEDINVLPVWQQGIYGRGIKILLIDDGVDVNHPDLKNRIDSNLQRVYPATGGVRPNIHGTAMAGIIAAERNNGEGVTGVAPESTIIPDNLLLITNLKEKNIVYSLTKNIDKIDISVNSWGAQDFTGQFNTLGDSWFQSIEYGLKQGRNGKGTIYLWSAGNGASETEEIDNSNYDGQANFYGVIAVCAVNKTGKRAVYSEKGANLWLCAPSSEKINGAGYGMFTTDVTDTGGMNNIGAPLDYKDLNYTKRFGGTSGAVAITGAVVALMLEVNPNLGWRDVKIILAESARQNDRLHTGWKTTNGKKISDGTYFQFSHEYGFGVVDAQKAVQLSRHWQNVPALVTTTFEALRHTSHSFHTKTHDTLVIAKSNIKYIEFIEIETKWESNESGTLAIEIESPSGTIAKLTELHSCLKDLRKVKCQTPPLWRFGSSATLGENPEGTWKLRLHSTKDQHRLISWKIKIYGH